MIIIVSTISISITIVFNFVIFCYKWVIIILIRFHGFPVIFLYAYFKDLIENKITILKYHRDNIYIIQFLKTFIDTSIVQKVHTYTHAYAWPAICYFNNAT